jgi:hypothetical protein
VFCDDAELGYASVPASGMPYTRFGTFSRSTLDEAGKKDWVVISMKDDRKRIFSFEPQARRGTMKQGGNMFNHRDGVMGKPSRLCMLLALAALLSLGAAPAACGCGFHSPLGVQLEGMYPGSLSVAVALRSAADHGLIDATALEAPGKGTALYADTVRRLQAFRKTLAASSAAADLPASFSLGYVESRLWARYSQSDGTIRVDVHTDGPAEGEAVVLTGEPVLTEVLAGRLSVDRALADGVLVIVGDESEKTAIRHALIATSMANRISRR